MRSASESRRRTRTGRPDGEVHAVTRFYRGGPKGAVSHIDAMWYCADGQREDLTADERALVLQRVIDEARKRENMRLEVEGG